MTDNQNHESRFEDYRNHMDDNFSRLTALVREQGVKIDAMATDIHKMEIVWSKSEAAGAGKDEKLEYRVQQLEGWQGGVNKQLIAIVMAIIIGLLMQWFNGNATQPEPAPARQQVNR